VRCDGVTDRFIPCYSPWSATGAFSCARTSCTPGLHAGYVFWINLPPYQGRSPPNVTASFRLRSMNSCMSSSFSLVSLPALMIAMRRCESH
jgi:hypothetical protein